MNFEKPDICQIHLQNLDLMHLAEILGQLSDPEGLKFKKNKLNLRTVQFVDLCTIQNNKSYFVKPFFAIPLEELMTSLHEYEKNETNSLPIE